MVVYKIHKYINRAVFYLQLFSLFGQFGQYYYQIYDRRALAIEYKLQLYIIIKKYVYV